MAWLLFIILGIAHLVCIYLEAEPFTLITKAALMPIAAWGVYKTTRLRAPFLKGVVVALLFGWLGDILLHFNGFAFFASGLSAFLIGHIFYIRAYSAEISYAKVSHYIMEEPYLILPFLAFFGFILFQLGTAIDDIALKIPVLLYCFVILIMSFMALNRKNAVSFSSWLIVFVGSLFFVISDYCIAIHRFIEPIPFHRYIIMSTYIIAQGSIAYGLSKQYAIKD